MYDVRGMEIRQRAGGLYGNFHAERPCVPVVGVAFTGSLATTWPKLGDHSESDLSVESEELYNEDEELAQLLGGQIDFKVYDYYRGNNSQNEERKIILPGSSNPLHNGHLKLLEVASKTVIISNQPFFHKKAELFPGSAFVIGADTASRLVNPKYYDGNYNKMIEILLGCKKTGCTFLVGGRNVDGVFKVLDDIEIPDALKDMFIPIPAERFRVDISSTQIRRSLTM
ncbi:hypothetical protein AKJ16_DCAP04858 [Drosera capensis]